MLKSTEHEIYPAHKCYNANNIVGTLTFISKINTALARRIFTCHWRMLEIETNFWPIKCPQKSRTLYGWNAFLIVFPKKVNFLKKDQQKIYMYPACKELRVQLPRMETQESTWAQCLRLSWTVTHTVTCHQGASLKSRDTRMSEIRRDIRIEIKPSLSVEVSFKRWYRDNKPTTFW